MKSNTAMWALSISIAAGWIFHSNTTQAKEFKPFLEVELGYRLTENQDDADWNMKCKLPAWFSFGVENKNGTAFGIRHTSNYDCGWPVNKTDEYVSDALFFRWKFWGMK